MNFPFDFISIFVWLLGSLSFMLVVNGTFFYASMVQRRDIDFITNACPVVVGCQSVIFP